MKLIIVESPSKIKTIQKYVGDEYKVVASVGHIMDLAKGGKYGIGVDVNNNFKTSYVMNKDKLSIIDDLILDSSKSTEILLMTDPDREGERISYDLSQLLKSTGKPMFRAEFNEITHSGIEAGLRNKHDIDINMVRSQEARRILDRIVGFMASPFLINFYGSNLSAGRVQSVCVRMVVDRENEISNFIPDEYWNVHVKFSDQSGNSFVAKLDKRLSSKDETDKVIAAITKSNDFFVSAVKRQSKKEKPLPPLTTASLQRYMARKHSFEPERTMKSAQTLYESGYCTYIRTDATRISEDAIKSVRKWIRDNNFDLPAKSNEYKEKENAQNAHECIRPTNVSSLATSGFLTGDDKLVYEAIWKHFVASQMNSAIWDTLSISISSKSNNKLTFKVSGKALSYKGYLEIFGDTNLGKIDIPNLQKGDLIVWDGKSLKSEQKFTQPPPRYNNDALLKELEDKQIGRPATYADIIAKITNRAYVEKVGATYRPTDLGKKITGILIDLFQFMDYNYSAEMEKQLDEIAAGNLIHTDMLKQFFIPFRDRLNEAYIKNGSKICEKCKSHMVNRKSKDGKSFLGCSAYPRCRNVINLVDIDRVDTQTHACA